MIRDVVVGVSLTVAGPYMKNEAQPVNATIDSVQLLGQPDPLCETRSPLVIGDQWINSTVLVVNTSVPVRDSPMCDTPLATSRLSLADSILCLDDTRNQFGVSNGA